MTAKLTTIITPPACQGVEGSSLSPMDWAEIIETGTAAVITASLSGDYSSARLAAEAVRTASLVTQWRWRVYA